MNKWRRGCLVCISHSLQIDINNKIEMKCCNILYTHSVYLCCTAAIPIFFCNRTIRTITFHISSLRTLSQQRGKKEPLKNSFTHNLHRDAYYLLLCFAHFYLFFHLLSFTTRVGKNIFWIVVWHGMSFFIRRHNNVIFLKKNSRRIWDTNKVCCS